MGESRGRAEFQSKTDVSRETMALLDQYESLLKKWNPSINLVAKSTLDDIWSRHFLDSAQILQYAHKKIGHWVDIGTGGGFPGAVVAVLARDNAPELRFTFVESDLRKATFLQTVIRDLGLNAEVLADRVEAVDCLNADILSARALAPLSKLLSMAERHLKPDGQALFMKGASFRRELTEALETWAFQSDEYRSMTDGAAVILSLGDIRRV